MSAYLTINSESLETQNYADKINLIPERKIAWLLAAVKAFLLIFFYLKKKRKEKKNAWPVETLRVTN